MLRRRSNRPVVIDGCATPITPGSGVSVYEIGGRVILRVVDWSDGPGIERGEQQVIDGFPGLDAAELGRAIAALAASAHHVERPESWGKLSEYARPLIDASPGGHRSYRSWQRSARHVSVSIRSDGVHVARLHADLDRGAWTPAEPGGLRTQGFPQSAAVPLPAGIADIGAAVLEILAQPPIAG